MIYDTAIIGTGAAGLSAALNLKIHNKRFLWFGSDDLSDKINKAEKIMNYPGLSSVTGKQLSDAFKKQIEDMDIEINERTVLSVMPMSKRYAVMAGSEFYEAKTVILATGINAVATVKGESEFLGRGVSYCATCDGNLYKDKTIAVICYSKRFEHEIDFLASLAEKVYLFAYYKNPSVNSGNIEIILKKAESIQGENRVQKIILGDGEEIAVDGVFCLRDSISLSSLFSGLETENGHIKTGRDMSTNLPGVFAAGDCTGRPYQYTKAAGEGNIAAHSVIEYLAKNAEK